MDLRVPAAKIKDFRTSHGDARTHTGDGKMGTVVWTFTETPETHVWRTKGCGTWNRVLNQQNSPGHSIAHLNAIPGLQDTAHAWAEDPVQRKVSALRCGQRWARKGERVGRGRKRRYLWAGPVGTGPCLPSAPPLSVLGLLVLLSSCASFLCLLMPLNLFDFLWSRAASCLF